MNIFIVTTALFFTTTVVFISYLFHIKKNFKKSQLELKNTKDSHQVELQKSKDNFNELNNKFNLFKDDISTKRIGYYNDSVTIISKTERLEGKPGELYKFTVYIKELDRYTNGTSKIQITNIEIFDGYNVNEYEYVKETTRRKFSSVKRTCDIEWLESEQSIKDIRKEKIKALNNLQNGNMGN
jgi:hypothetical protein